MVRALNEDEGPPGQAAATTGIGDRLVSASRGLGRSPGGWVHALASRTDPGGRPPEAIGRWLAEPARDRVWSALTGGAVTATGSQRWVRMLLSQVWWLAVAVTGLLVVGLAVVVADDAGRWAVLLGALGAGALVLGAVLVAVTRRLLGVRGSLAALAERLAGRQP